MNKTTPIDRPVKKAAFWYTTLLNTLY